MLDLESSSKRGVIGAGATLKPARASTTRRAGAEPR
jgi:hypothetical protein